MKPHVGRNGSKHWYAMIERNLLWLRELVRQRLGPTLRARAESGDYVNEVLASMLVYLRRCERDLCIEDDEQFRAVVQHVVHSTLCDQHDRCTAERRDPARVAGPPDEGLLEVDPPRRSDRTPSGVAALREHLLLVRRGLEELTPDDREIIALRMWKELSFRALGARLGIHEAAAAKRFQRALERLARRVEGVGAASLHGWREREADHE